MILGTGIDIIEVARVASSVERFGDRFLQRILRPPEIDYCLRHREPAPQIAVRFAAKEAISKAFGTGICAALGWHAMEIAKRESGEPYVILHDEGLQLWAQRAAQRLHVSLSHTALYATAMAILEG